MKKEKTVITIETFQRTIFRSLDKEKTEWCKQCAREVPMVTTDKAAALAATTARDIFRRIETGEIHFLETETGALLVCRDSCQNSLP